MVSWKSEAFQTLDKLLGNTHIPKIILLRTRKVIGALCSHCECYYDKHITCTDKALEIFPLADETGVQLEHRIQKDDKEIHFEFEIGEDNGHIFCEAYVCEIKNKDIISEIKPIRYSGRSIANFINKTFDDYYKNDCNSVIVLDEEGFTWI